MYRYILFDLDGTLSDPKVGICTSVQYALEKMGIEEKDIDNLVPFIGPPLRESFNKYYNMSEEECERAVSFYRERYSDVGKFENEIYPGIPELLRDLKKKEKFIAIASSKPTVYVEDILKHFEIREYFDLVVGAEPDGSRDTKEEVLGYALKEMFPEGEPEYDEVVMIGDRRYDIDAAHSLGVGNIGVSYGYGSREELEEAGADKIVNTVQGLRSVLLPVLGQGTTRYASFEKETADQADKKKGTDWKEESKSIGKKSFARTWSFIGPALTYWIGGTAFYYLLVMGVNLIASQNPAFADFATKNGAAFAHTIIILGYFIAALFLLKQFINKQIKKKDGEPLEKAPLSYREILYCATIVFVGIGFLGFIHYIGFWEANEAYMDYFNAKYSLPVWLGILLYGLIYPATQYFIFAGLCYVNAKNFMTGNMPLVITALLFAFVNSNSGEGLFLAVIMAVAIYAYEKTGNFVYPGVAYLLTFILVWFVETIPALKAVMTALPGVATMLVLGFGSLIFLAVMDSKKISDNEKTN